MPESSGSRTPRGRKCARKGKNKGDKEVLVHSSLPPQVDGQIRCFVVVQLKKVTWKTRKHPDDVFLRCLWWGEPSASASIFSPLESKVVARYPVRSGPKQMASYLIDAGTVHVEVLRGADMSVIGKVQIYGLSALAAGKTLSGPYPIFSPQSDIIGHINVNISMQALHMFDDSASSVVPTTDLDNTERSESRIMGQEKLDSKLGTPSAFSSDTSHSQIDKSAQLVDHITPTKRQQSGSRSPPRDRKSAVANEDLISHLLTKGQRLRSAMISSAVDAIAKSNEVVELDKLVLPLDTQFPESRNVLSSLTNVPKEAGRPCHHPEMKTVDLVLGSPRNKVVYVSDTDSGSVLDDNDFELSDFEDPLHDQEILDLLFYKHSRGKRESSSQVNAETLTDVPDSRPLVKKQQHRENVQQNDPIPPQNEKVDENNPRLDKAGNVRPVSRSPSPSPRVCLSPALSLVQSDSGASRVSFDMTASDDEDTRSAAEGLSVEQLTLLARVCVARVHIDQLNLRERPNTPVEKKTFKGRPPPAKTSKYGTYFVEYQFPVVAASRDQSERNTTATETVRAVSKKVDKSGVVTWNHHTVFPVFFDGQTIEKWWNSMLVFKIHHREPSSRTASLIGSCSIQMKQLLQSLTFGLDLDLTVTKHQKRALSAKKRRRRRADTIGVIKCNIQLDSDSPSFNTALRELQINKAKKQHPLLKPKPNTPIAAPSTPEYVKSSAPVKVDLQYKAPGLSHPGPCEQTDLMLHMLLHVSEGRGLRSLSSCTHSQAIVNGRTMSSYAVCRIFWSTDKLRSEVCWSTSTPNYLINETIPLHVTKDVLMNMSNNYMIVEVWEKRSTAQKDQLLGYAKLPLNTCYMSYKEPRIAQVLMKSQYPVIAVDTYLPIVNPLTGKNMGEVKILLAMGTQQQVMSLQTLKVIATATELETRQHSKVSQHGDGAAAVYTQAEREGEPLDPVNGNEHRFNIKVVSVRDLRLEEENMYLGEADCFVQYHFPVQHNLSDELIMKSFRSPTTLCTDSVTLDDLHSHLITLPGETNLQKMLASAFGSLHGSAVPFELWCRFYHPNTRDQLMARGLLPLAKFLGLITMSNNEPVSCQSYSLPLLPASNDRKVGSVGVLDITISHTKKSHQKLAYNPAPSHGLHNMGQVTMAVCVESVSGLKSAALALSHKHQCLDYYSTVGVNLYVKLTLSFQTKSDVRVSDTEARVFSLEDFGFKCLFPLPLMMDNHTSLAHCLQSGYLIIEVWHQSLKDSLLDDCPGIPPSTDIQLGLTSVPLANLLSHKTGIRGWYPVSPPPELYTTNEKHDPMLGALKVQLNLTGSQDISHIIDSASKIGYQISSPGLDATDTVIDELTELHFEVDWFTIPAGLVLYTEHEDLPISSVCYLKTSFYNNDIAYSNALRLTDKGDNFECKCDVRFKYLQTISTSLLWHMFDQQLELELWLSTRRDSVSDEITPSSNDRYLGTTYIPLDHLSRRRQCTVSDVYPIYKPAVDRMGRSLMQVHISRKPHQEPELHHMKTQRIQTTDEAPVQQLDDLNCSDQSEGYSLDEDSVESMISIEEANRLTTGQSPETTLYVTYSLAGKEHITPGVPASSKPSWMYEKCVRLHLPSIQQSKHLVLKLWSKCDSKGSQVIGFTTIDLRPLLAGMSHLSGWYNIVDFTGLCQGQIKCGIQPLTSAVIKPVNDDGRPSPKQTKSTLPSTARYHTQSEYEQYPSHLSGFTEQRVHFSHIPSLPSSSSTSSELLRKQLAELDIMTNRLREKLYESARPTAVHSQGPVTHHPGVCLPQALESTRPSNKLIETVSQVHNNLLQLANHGVINPEHIMSPHNRLPSRERDEPGAYIMDRPLTGNGSSTRNGSHADEKSQASDVYPTGDGAHTEDCQRSALSNVNNSQEGGERRDSASSIHVSVRSEEHKETLSEEEELSPFTPRTQATYSMTSDEEQFSPPIYIKSDRHGGITSQSEIVESSDWASDGVRPLESDDEISPSRLENSEAANQVVSLNAGLDGGGPSVDDRLIDSMVDLYTTPGHSVGARANVHDSDIQEVMSLQDEEEVMSEADVEGAKLQAEPLSDDDGEYEEEEAVSRTINENLFPLGADDEIAHQQAFGTFHDSTLKVDNSVIGERKPGLPQTHSVNKSPELANAGYGCEESANESLECLESTNERHDGEKSVEYLSDEGETNLPLVNANQRPDSMKSNDVGNDPQPQTDDPLPPHGTEDQRQPVTNPPSSLPARLPSQLPSFFPSREELEAKMRAARNEPSQQVAGRFSGRKPIIEIVRENRDSSDQAKRLADIFATRFDKH